MDKNLQLKISNLSDEIKKVVRRQDELQKSVDLLFADREILEDLQGSIKHLQEIILANQVHQDNTKKDLKADVKEVGLKVEETQAIVEDATTSIKETVAGDVEKKNNLIQKLRDKLLKK